MENATDKKEIRNVSESTLLNESMVQDQTCPNYNGQPCVFCGGGPVSNQKLKNMGGFSENCPNK